MSFLITITVGQSSMQFFPSLLIKKNRILRHDGSISSLNIFRIIKNVEKSNNFSKQIAVVRK